MNNVDKENAGRRTPRLPHIKNVKNNDRELSLCSLKGAKILQSKVLCKEFQVGDDVDLSA